MKTIAAILHEIRPEFDFKASQDFFQEGLLDSFDLVVLLSKLSSEFGVTIQGSDVVPENFRNISAICSLLGRYGVNGIE